MALNFTDVNSLNQKKHTVVPTFDPHGHMKGKENFTAGDFQSFVKQSKDIKIDTGNMGGLLVDDIKEQLEFSTKLFLTQLQNQIPGNETNTDDMIRTLMGMMQAVQQVRTNTLLEDGTKVQTALFAAEMGRYQGSIAEYEGNIFNFDGKEQEMFVSLPEGTAQAILVISDESGVVRRLPLDPSLGRRKIVWDGMDDSEINLNNGIYGTVLVAVDKDGKQLKGGKLTINSLITSVYFDEGNRPVLMAGDVEIDNIERVHKRYQSQSPVRTLEQATETETVDTAV